MSDAAIHARQELDVERISSELTHEFNDVSPQDIELGVREEFDRRSDSPVRDFVPIFVQRSLRGKLRSDHD
jgi:hypothetical protein